MSSLGKMEIERISSVAGDLNKRNTVFGNYHEKFHWVVYEMLFMKELKSNKIHTVTPSLGFLHVLLC